MRTEEILILGREDLTKINNDKDVSLINLNDFRTHRHPLIHNGIILFIDSDNGQTKIIKNRYGDYGNSSKKVLPSVPPEKREQLHEGVVRPIVVPPVMVKENGERVTDITMEDKNTFKLGFVLGIIVSFLVVSIYNILA